MAWDKDLPDGDLDAAQLDDDVRTNNDALEDALDLEHYFATGGSQHGRHKFGIGTTAARDALANISNGMIYFNTDALSGYTVLQVRSSGSWVNASILDTTVARLGLQNLWTKPQYATWETLTLSGGNLTIDFSTSPKKKANIGANFTVLNPTNDTPGPSASSEIVLDLTMTGSGGWTVTWGNKYRGPNGIAPVISATTGHVTRVYISGMADGNYLVTTLPNIADI
jgi:hypothetical protein